ncbi:efflux RND transporter permease subunit [Candidatus Viadribacter manganicus]|uniref:Multidrug transporter AcrB n=1 Tax=Candidatus Viadribacter manganicus TaxID=1759059 RepID=A0A1B1AJR9_9PROT|nr:efflux RND transporter permease subunit [Candidatus Viadribacter manganicus]ANP46795.1 multidrug transporter AcrB [Candidatus Viadribacter manganicus]
MQAITRFFVDRWQFSAVLFALLVALGIGAIFSIPKSEDPITEFPGVAVAVILPGADAEQMERLVAIPIEDQINAIEDIREIRSASRAGLAIINVEFEWGADAEEKFGEVVREINVVRPNLPDGVVDIRMRRYNPAQAAIVQMALTSDDASFRQLEAYAKGLRDALERAPGVQQAEVWGAPPAEVRVAANLDQLAAYRLPLAALGEALQREGVDTPIGAVEAGGRRFNVQSSGSFDSLDEIRRVALRAQNGSLLTVGDVADVSWANDERAHITRFNGQRALFVSAQARLGESIFDVIDGVRPRVDAFEQSLPANIQLHRGFDQSETVTHRLGNLARDFAIALALVLLTLLPLGFRASIVVMVSIPLSLAIGVVAIQELGYSLNQLSIAGFVLALGLLVDDSIVVTENIARHLRQGMTPREAAIAGVSEINIAVIGCTATLLLAFVPLMALPEGAGAFVRSLPVAVVTTIIASLFVALTIIPFLASRLLPRSGSGHSNALLDGVMGAIHNIYRPALHVALAHPRKTVFAGLAAFVLSLGLIPHLGFSLFPENDSPYFLVDIETPQGSAVSETDNAVLYAERVLASHPEIEWRFANSGRGNPQIYYNEIPPEQLSNQGQIYARFHEWRRDEGMRVIGEIREQLSQYPRARMNLRRFANGPPIEAPIAVRINGPDLAALGELASEVERIIRETPGAREVSNPTSERLIDLDLNVDDAAAALRGVQAGAIDHSLRIAIAGLPVAQFRDPAGDAFPVVLRAPRGETLPVSALDRLYIWNGQGGATPLAEIAHPTMESGPASIDRVQRERTATVTAYTEPGFLISGVTADVAQRLEALRLPAGYTVSFGGEAEAQARSFGGLGPAILIAIFGVLAVLLLEFGTFAVTGVVAFVIPFGIMGGLIALFIGGESLSFTAIIGFVALIGIEIKNSILLVEFANQARTRGVPLREAIETAGEVRFLPVLLTSATAIGGMTPLLLEDSPLFSPIAMVLIGGLISSTLIARIVTPAMYLLLAPKDEAQEASA